MSYGTDYAPTNISFVAPNGYEVEVSLEVNAIIARLYLTTDEIFTDGFD